MSGLHKEKLAKEWFETRSGFMLNLKKIQNTNKTKKTVFFQKKFHLNFKLLRILQEVRQYKLLLNIALSSIAKR